MVLVTLSVLLTIIPSQPITCKLIVPLVNVDSYFILTELPFLNKLIPIVVELETDQEYDTASVVAME